MPFSPDKFQIPTFSLLLQLLIFQGRNNWETATADMARHVTPLWRGRGLPQLGGGSLMEHPQHWQLAHSARWPILQQVVLVHIPPGSALPPFPTDKWLFAAPKPTLSTHRLLHTGVCSLLWFPTEKRLKIPPPVPRFSTKSACCDEVCVHEGGFQAWAIHLAAARTTVRLFP